MEQMQICSTPWFYTKNRNDKKALDGMTKFLPNNHCPVLAV